MPGTVAARQFSAPLMLTSISASMSSGAASHEAVARTGAEALLTRMSASSPPSGAQHGVAMGDVERQRPAAGLARELAELVGRAGDGIDIEPADAELADRRRADAAAGAGHDGGAVAIERHRFSFARLAAA